MTTNLVAKVVPPVKANENILKFYHTEIIYLKKQSSVK